MATKKNTEGVGKKIVEALKKQAEPVIEEHEPILSNTEEDFSQPQDETTSLDMPEDSFDNMFDENVEDEYIQPMEDLNAESDDTNTSDFDNSFLNTSFNINDSEPAQILQHAQNNFTQENETNSENVKILGNLINQLPPGISKQMGAHIIKQTMEALGISMKTVLNEAQQIQENLSMSSRECLNSIQEYKQQIQAMEKQVQAYHRQYNALNELISLFVQTGI